VSLHRRRCFGDRADRPVRRHPLPEVGLAAQAEPVTKDDSAGLKRPSARLALPDKPAIAVLPFVNMSGDSEQKFFADGITEDILGELSRFRELFVISRNSAFVYKGKSINAQKVAKELGFQYVVEGSVRNAGSRAPSPGAQPATR
jgi:adenylate cyclase